MKNLRMKNPGTRLNRDGDISLILSSGPHEGKRIGSPSTQKERGQGNEICIGNMSGNGQFPEDINHLLDTVSLGSTSNRGNNGRKAADMSTRERSIRDTGMADRSHMSCFVMPYSIKPRPWQSKP